MQTREPVLELDEDRGIEFVVAAGAVLVDDGEPLVAQDLEMLRDRRLGDRELPADRRDDLAGRLWTAREQFENAAANRICEDLEPVHGPTI